MEQGFEILMALYVGTLIDVRKFTEWDSGTIWVVSQELTPQTPVHARSFANYKTSILLI